MKSFSNSKLSKVLFLVLLPSLSFAQLGDGNELSVKRSSKSNFLFPIKPGQPNFLSGTMGELRDTHFHGGIDIRTDNRIGLPVLCTQDGYISKADVSAGGYGTALLVTHPNGLVSLYGHLSRYSGKLADRIRTEQYRKKEFEVEMNFGPEEFPVTKGDTLAFSGNTGSSLGPHLHFEIRDGKYVLNPLKFGFTEITDNLPPIAHKIALRTLDINSRINDRFGRFEFSILRKSPTEYIIPVPIMAHGRIGIELLADDRMDNSSGRCGINYIEVFADSDKVFSQTIERVDLEETRNILAVMDFKTLEMKGKRFNKLFIDHGNRMDFYTSKDGGVITVDEKDKAISISLRDVSGNQSKVRLTLKSTPLGDELILVPKKKFQLEADLLENVLVITTTCAEPGKISLHADGKTHEIPSSYHGNREQIYLADLRKVLPDSISTCSGNMKFNFKDMIPSETDYSFYSDWVDVYFPKDALYDTLFLNISRESGTGMNFSIGQRTTPLHRAVRVVVKPEIQNIPAKNMAIYRREGRRYAYLGGEWSNGKIRFFTRELGEFAIIADSLAPSITRIRLDRNSARFRTRDALSGVAYYEASVNGQWLLMSYDFKTGILQSDKLDPAQPLKGDFELKVVDQAGNERIFRQKIL